MKPGEIAEVRRILIVAQTGIGNLLMCLPMIGAIHRMFPEAAIDALVNPNGSGVFIERFPGIGRVIQMSAEESSTVHGLIRLLVKLRWKYDMVIFRFSTIFRFANIFLRFVRPDVTVGFRSAGRFSEKSDHLFTLRVDPPRADQDEIDINLGMARAISAHFARQHIPTSREVHLRLEAADYTTAESFLGENSKRGMVAVHPFVSPGQPWKTWKPDRWRELVGDLLASGFRVVVLGAPNDEDGLKELLRGMEAPNLLSSSELPLSATAAVLDLADALISCDSSLMHIAAALGKRQVVVWGPTDLSRTRPSNPKAVILSRPCACNQEGLSRADVERIKACADRKCLNSTRPADVLRSLAQLGVEPQK